MKTGILIVLIATIVSFSSCHKCTEADKIYYLGAKDHLQLVENNKLIYKDNNGIRDTFCVMPISHKFNFTPYGGYCDDRGTYEEMLYYSLKNKNKIEINYSFNGFLVVYYGNYPVQQDNLGYVGNTSLLSEFQVNGQSYSNVHYIQRDSSKIDTLKIWKAYISESYGFISFEFKNGTKWELEKIINP